MAQARMAQARMHTTTKEDGSANRSSGAKGSSSETAEAKVQTKPKRTKSKAASEAASEAKPAAAADENTDPEGTNYEYNPWELVWAKGDRFPLWPCAVVPHSSLSDDQIAALEVHKKKKKGSKSEGKGAVIVEFFGDKPSWGPADYAISYEEKTVEEVIEAYKKQRNYKPFIIKGLRLAAKIADEERQKIGFPVLAGGMVQCEGCKAWRYLPQGLNLDQKAKWYCPMNTWNSDRECGVEENKHYPSPPKKPKAKKSAPKSPPKSPGKKAPGGRSTRCRKCASCITPDCGKCSACKDKPK